MTDKINRLAYLNTLDENKKPLDLLLEIIEIESYKYDFNQLGIISTDGKSIKDIINNKYNIEIEDYILTKWINDKFYLENNKIRLRNKNNSESLEKKIGKIEAGEKKFLEQVSEIRNDFINFAREKFNIKYNNEQSKNIFNEYIYTVAQEKNVESKDSRNYFVFQEYLSYLCKNNLKALEIIENFGVANQIQDLVLNGDTDKPKFLNDCIIFLDTPIIMKRLGYDGIELSDIYKSFFSDLTKAGATLKIFTHTFEELWGILFNFKRCVSQNIFDAKGVNTFLKARKQFITERNIELSLSKEIIQQNILNIGIDFFDISEDDNLENTTDYSEWNFDPDTYRKHVINTDENYEKYKTRLEKDIQSISAVSRLRQRNKIKKIENFEDGKYYLLVDNYALVNAIKSYYKEKEERYKKNELLLENTIIFNLWQNLSNNGNLNKALFRSKCFALNTIDDNFKDALYREARRIEAYNAEIEINQQLINDPTLENEVFAETIRNNKMDKEYISKTLLNSISQKEVQTKELIKKQQKELQQKDFEIQKTQIDYNNLINKYEQSEDAHQKIMAEQIEKTKDESNKAVIDSQISTILNTINHISKSFLTKIHFLLKKIKNKNLDKKKFLWDKACSITGISIEYNEKYIKGEI